MGCQLVFSFIKIVKQYNLYPLNSNPAPQNGEIQSFNWKGTVSHIFDINDITIIVYAVYL